MNSVAAVAVQTNWSEWMYRPNITCKDLWSKKIYAIPNYYDQSKRFDNMNIAHREMSPSKPKKLAFTSYVILT